MNQASQALDEIRRTELDAARRVEEARGRSTEIVSDAKGQAHQIVERARLRGRETAERRMEEAKTEVEAEARAVTERGEAAARHLRDIASGRMAELVDGLVEVVLAPPEGSGG